MFLNAENRYFAEQDDFLKIPGNPVAYWVSANVFRLLKIKILMRMVLQSKE